MSTERFDEAAVRRRAGVHAALADPARLRIVDRLWWGDARPGELQRLLDMPSNLVAHHLHVLEKEGLLVRHRSQGDRRRTYVSLVADAFDDLMPQAAVPSARVVFVCTANTARSQLAAALWRGASVVPVASAGTRPAERVAPGALAVARRRGLPMRRVHPRPLNDVVRDDDLVVTVCDSAHEELVRAGVSAEALHWSVPDPVADGRDAAFDAVYDDLAARVTHLAGRVVPLGVEQPARPRAAR